MEDLGGARVLLGVCGSIAAYKAVEVCRRLVDAGAHVVPVMTADAERFVGAVTLSALASEPVRTSLWTSSGADDGPVPHIALARSVDVILVAPATARFLGAYAAGIADDLLVNILLATTAPVVVCPAMHTEMWEHPATRANVALLRQRGAHVVEPATGRLAGGDEGAGRLPDPEPILAAVAAALAGRSRSAAGPDLAGRRVLVTAGGTREPVDAVRFLGNRSSGKQGEAVAVEAAARGASVVLVTAAGDRPSPPGVEVVRVDTAAEMEAEVRARALSADAVVMAAAVADFRPKAAADGKLRKDEGVPDVVLEPTADILAALGRARRPGQVLVGFAAETGDPRPRAREKLRAKGVDAIVANDVTAPGAGFGHDTNAVVIIEDDGREVEIGLTSKQEVARAVVDMVARRLGDGRLA
ncbi:MAG: phosphopantothenoylcysteine decarboxylase / phosphopantothenate---cysteine ligase [Actinomycetota bacterium]|jgi:phosphopantothenoylcysteine decarboxylase/phosphopantothenate--cysteine ligase|nr:phosphopantothenoylcysteine decarboxylase / phosphopantothenate---cysteine ligase [Actinomycetota bacterium]